MAPLPEKKTRNSTERHAPNLWIGLAVVVFIGLPGSADSQGLQDLLKLQATVSSHTQSLLILREYQTLTDKIWKWYQDIQKGKEKDLVPSRGNTVHSRLPEPSAQHQDLQEQLFSLQKQLEARLDTQKLETQRLKQDLDSQKLETRRLKQDLDSQKQETEQVRRDLDTQKQVVARLEDDFSKRTWTLEKQLDEVSKQLEDERNATSSLRYQLANAEWLTNDARATAALEEKVGQARSHDKLEDIVMFVKNIVVSANKSLDDLHVEVTRLRDDQVY